MISALFVETDGCYFNLKNIDPWDIKRDARKYNLNNKIIAHPPSFPGLLCSPPHLLKFIFAKFHFALLLNILDKRLPAPV